MHLVIHLTIIFTGQVAQEVTVLLSAANLHKHEL
jgi:hypothetical protein